MESIRQSVLRQGYCVLKSWLPARWSDRLTDGLDELDRTRPGEKRLMPHQPFLDLLADPLLHPLLEPILGDTYLFHHANGKRITDGAGKVWHHDYDGRKPWDGADDTTMVHVMIYPRGLRADSGPLVLRPGSHLEMVPRHEPNRYGYSVDPGDVTVIGPPGTVVVLNSATWHMRPESTSDPRHYLNVSYIGPGAAERPERDEYAELLTELPALASDGAGRARLAALCRQHSR
jgi:ectoine hydroxylase-related dioxygenase (phytanoyl-CoA dioxygenase family)